jgi:hypothetical protein
MSTVDRNVYRKTTQRQRKFQAATPLLPPERAALGQTSLATGGLAQDGGAALADDDGLGVREDGGDGEAAGALDVHEERSGGGHEGLELVLPGLGSRGRVQEINSENHIGDMCVVGSCECRIIWR